MNPNDPHPDPIPFPVDPAAAAEGLDIRAGDDPVLDRLVDALRAPAPVAFTRTPADMARVAVESESDSWGSGLRVAAAGAVLLAGLTALLLVRGPRAPDPAEIAARERGRAVAGGVDWLLAAQEADGSWAPANWGGHDSFRRGLTGLAVVALAADPKPSPRARDALARAGRWLANPASAPVSSRDAPYNLGFSALALVEAGARLPALRDSASAALREVIRAQRPDGGWGYSLSGGPGYDSALGSVSNASATTWPLRALQRARALGWPGLDDSCGRGERWLASRRGPDGRAGYRMAGDYPFGWETLTAMADWLAPRGPATAPASVDGDYYTRFFLSRTAPDPARAALARQLTRDQEKGSWPASGDRWSSAGGRLYTTCFALLSLRDV